MQDSNSDMALQWTAADKAVCKRAEVIIHQQNVDPRDIDHKTLPTDIHLVHFKYDGRDYCDAVRASKMADIFDVYHDKIREEGKGGEVVAIKSGYGTIKPKLYNPDKTNDNK